MDLDHPFHIGPRGKTAVTGGDEHVRDMIEQFLFTEAGERVNRPDFGSGLLALVFEPNSPERAAAVELAIQAGLLRWLGDVIEVRRVDVTVDEATLVVEIDYLVLLGGEPTTETFERGRA